MSTSLTWHRLDPDVRRLLEGATGPAMVVAIASARLVTASGAGRAWLGAAAAQDGAALDAAMPAIVRLRELAAGLAPGTRCRVRLTFWTDRGASTAVTEVVLLAGQAGEPLAVVEIGEIEGQPEQAMADAVEASGEASEPNNPPPVPRDDAATLREIARRIREGQRLRASGAAPPAVASAVVPPVVEPPAVAVEAAAAVAMEPWAMPNAAPANPPGVVIGDPEAPPPSRPARATSRTVAAEAPPQEQARGAGSARLAKLAHELKTPLSAIAAAAEIMRDERLGPIENARYRSYASDIFDSARHALMVIGNMLGDASAGLESDHGSALPAMVFAELDLNAIAESCVSSMRPLADAAGLALSATLEPGLPHVVADATAVRQIVLNLLNNALKFTGAGGEIGLATRHAPDGRVELEIRDTGRGMSAEEIARAGTTGSPASLSRREGGGLGIGLPLVGALARANGAGLAIASEPLIGTRVSVSFAKDRVVPV